MNARAWGAVLAAVLTVGEARAARPQDAPTEAQRWLARGFDFEDAGRLDSAAAYFRRVLASDERAQGLLGLERVYALEGRRRDIVAVADSVLAREPRSALATGVKVRALTAAADRALLRSTLTGWSTALPGELDPWREAVRALLEAGQPLAADSIAEEAVAFTRTRTGMAAELGQVRARLGRWEAAAQSYRDALRESEWLVETVAYVLRETPIDRRPTTTAALLAAPTSAAARRAAGQLRAGWGDWPGAWQALKPLPANDSTASEWAAFGARARRAGAAAVAVEAWVSALEVRRRASVALDAAEASLDAGDASTALDLVLVAERSADSAGTAARRAVLRTRGLAALGRTAEASRIVEGLDDRLARRRAAAALAEGQALAGDLAGAARTADREGLEVEDDPAAAWVALWRGDLAAARRGVAALGEGPRPAGRATALLARTRTERSPALGAAFLALARRDSLAAQAAFAKAADEAADIAGALRLEAARVADARRDVAAADALWEAIVVADARSPEAAEARLARARARIRRGQPSAARADLEALILEQPASALVPQARRELERLAGGRP